MLLLTAHHIVCDGWSFGVMVRELAALYARGAARGATPTWRRPIRSPTTRWREAARADSEAQRADEAYWLARFAERAGAARPAARPRRARAGAASPRGARTDCWTPRWSARVKRLGAQRGASLFATLLGGFGALLHRLTGQDDVVVGIPAAGPGGRRP